MSNSLPSSDSVTAYAQSVVDGAVPAGKWQRKACARHLADLAAEDSPWVFRPELAAKAFGIFGLFRHYKGDLAGERIRLEPWQQFIVGSLMGWVSRETGLRRYRNAFIELPRGSGKSTIAGGMLVLFAFFLGEGGAEAYSVAPLALDTPVPTLSGWTTMGDVRVGDTVFDEAGRPTRVSYVSPIETTRQCYRLTFHDGTSVVADAEHRWQVLSVLSGVGSMAGRPRATWHETACSLRSGSHILTTAEMAASVKTSWGSKNHCIPVVSEPLDLPSADLPIPPYTLGVWLGDGRSNRGAITTHPDDHEIVVGIQTDGFEFSSHAHGARLIAGTILGLRTKLRTAGLLHNKHVPAAYLRACSQQRLALLQGLMDTDGTCTKTGECRFTNRNERLARAVHELATSMGLLAHFREVTVTDSPHYVVSFRAPRSLPVFALPRKYVRQLHSIQSKARRRFITSIEPVESVPVRCLSVEAKSHLFLVGRGMVATHNTKRDQARISFQAGRQMLLRSSALKKHVTIGKYNIHNTATESKMEALGAEADTLDGLRPFIVVVDEVHKLKSPELVEVMESGMGTRLDPLLFEITTAGDDDQSVYGQHFLLSTRVLDGSIDLPQWFTFIAAADAEDDWTSVETWKKANPNYGVSVRAEFLESECRKAVANPAEQAKFRRLYLGQKVQSADGYFSVEDWRNCPDLPGDDELLALPCWMGFDLSSTTDITAAVLVWKMGDEFAVRPVFWMPEDTIEDRSHEDRMPYAMWARQGLINLTPGRTIDRQMVRRQVVALAKTWKVKEFCADPWQMHDLGKQLAEEDGVPVVLVPQRYEKLSMPMKIVQGKILERRIRHDHHPLMGVMVSNVTAKPDDRGNVMTSKRKSRGRIDGMQALINAVAQIPVVSAAAPQLFFVGGKS